MAIKAELIAYPYYAPPPQGPNPFAEMVSGFVQTRNETAKFIVEERLKQADPVARAQAMAQLEGVRAHLLTANAQYLDEQRARRAGAMSEIGKLLQEHNDLARQYISAAEGTYRTSVALREQEVKDRAEVFRGEIERTKDAMKRYIENRDPEARLEAARDLFTASVDLARKGRNDAPAWIAAETELHDHVAALREGGLGPEVIATGEVDPETGKPIVEAFAKGTKALVPTEDIEFLRANIIDVDAEFEAQRTGTPSRASGIRGGLVTPERAQTATAKALEPLLIQMAQEEFGRTGTIHPAIAEGLQNIQQEQERLAFEQEFPVFGRPFERFPTTPRAPFQPGPTRPVPEPAPTTSFPLGAGLPSPGGFPVSQGAGMPAPIFVAPRRAPVAPVAAGGQRELETMLREQLIARLGPTPEQTALGLGLRAPPTAFPTAPSPQSAAPPAGLTGLTAPASALFRQFGAPLPSVPGAAPALPAFSMPTTPTPPMQTQPSLGFPGAAFLTMASSRGPTAAELQQQIQARLAAEQAALEQELFGVAPFGARFAP